MTKHLKPVVLPLAVLFVAMFWADAASAQLKITITPKVTTRNVTKNSCKARLKVNIKAVDVKTSKTVFFKSLQSAEVTLPKNVEITIPPPPPPPGLNITMRARFTGTEVSGYVRVELQVLVITATATKSFRESVEIN